MKRNAALLKVSAVIALALATSTCNDALHPGLPLPNNEIVDGANNGNPHFFFLPPLVPQPATNGAFDGSLSPVVEICALQPQCASPIATYSLTSGVGSERLRL